MPHRSGYFVALTLFAFLTVVYAASPVSTPFDSRWSIHSALSLFEGQWGDLSDYLPVLKKNDFFAIEYPRGRPHTVFPIGVSLLCSPIVGALALVDPTFKDRLTKEVPKNLERILASIFGAAAAAVFFWLMLERFQQLTIALATTFIFSLCTSMWSTATRALWQHGPLVLMLVIAMLLLMRARRQPQLVQYVGLPLAMAYLMRPTAIVPIAILSLYVLLYYRDYFVRYLCWAMLIGVPWVVYNVAVYKALVPPYYTRGAFSAETRFAEGLLGNLFSPSRGLLIFSPVLVFALSGFVLALRDHAQRPLNIAYAAIVVVTII